MIEVLGIKVGFIKWHDGDDKFAKCQCGWTFNYWGEGLSRHGADVLLHHMNCHASQRALMTEGYRDSRDEVEG